MEFVLKEARISLRETQHLPKVNKTRFWREGGAAHPRAALDYPPTSAFPWLTQSEAPELPFCPRNRFNWAACSRPVAHSVELQLQKADWLPL